MNRRMIEIKDAEITFKDTHQTCLYDLVILHQNAKWVTAVKYQHKNKEKPNEVTKVITRWFPMVRIFEVRQDEQRDKKD